MKELAGRLRSVDSVAAELPGRHRRAAVAVALRGEGRGVLLMRRAEREGDLWSGQVSLPGGHEEAGDEDLAATAARETREEVGVDLEEHGRLLGALTPVQARARGRRLETSILPAVFALEAEVEPTPGPEATEAFWFPLDRAARGELDGTHTHWEGGVTRDFPCWKFEGRVVWGLTLRILGELLAEAAR